jgi:hypothetical protein
LQSLALGKVRVLSKTPQSKEISASDVFTLNEGFTSKLIKVKVPQIVAKEVSEERQVALVLVVTPSHVARSHKRRLMRIAGF